jgi:G3E family GTPase
MSKNIKKPIPVTVLSGFLGAGKTTVLNYVLNTNHGLKLAVIVNDMSELNIDSQIVKDNAIKMGRSEEKLVEMSNGCICCTLREDLLIEIKKIVQEDSFDGIIIESSGISEPLPVAYTFTFEHEPGSVLMDVARLDTMVTVVDSKNFMENFAKTSTLADEKSGVSEDDTRSISHLLTDQVEFADVILLSKIDLVEPSQVEVVKSIIKKLNPIASVYEISNGKIDINSIFNTGKFSMEEATQSAGWIKEMNEEHVPETEEYGITSFVYSSDKMFSGDKLLKVIQDNKLENVVRSKGFVWVDNKPDQVLMWSHAGNVVNIDPYGKWKKSKGGSFQGEQKVVFIGMGMDKEKITDVLNECLVK